MNEFFASARPGRPVTVGATRFELPVLYFRDDSFAAEFPASLEALRRLMPSDRLHPVPTTAGRGLVLVAAYDYFSTSVGPYGEVCVAVPVVHGRRPPPLVPALLESRWPGFGYLVLHLPVTTRIARDGGRSVWGYTKFIADMTFENTPERFSCRLEEGGAHILTLRVDKRGVTLPDRSPITTYSVKDGDLLRTRIAQKTLSRSAFTPGGSALELGDAHPVARSLRALAIEPRPLVTRSFFDRYAILPEGEIVERGVRPLDGYAGAERDAGRLEQRQAPPPAAA